MVFNACRVAQLPFSNAQMKPHTKIMRGKGLGTGMGSILLRLGGAGGASSYMDIDDYVSQTGINPYSRAKKSSGEGLGTGMKKMREKLAKLTIEEPSMSKPKVRKIQMSM